MTDILLAEWSKLRTGRPLVLAVGVLVVFTGVLLGIAAAFVTTWDGLPPQGRASSSMASLTELLGWIASFVLAVFGAVVMASEWSSGQIRMTFLAMPRRGRVLAAKAILVAAVSLVATGVTATTTTFGTAWIVGERVVAGQEALGLASVTTIVAVSLSAVVFGLIGLALGTITRSALVSVVALVLTWYVVPLLAMRAPAPLDRWLQSILPGSLSAQLSGSTTPSVFGHALGPVGAVLAMVAYAVVPLVLAAIALRRRDV